MTELHINLELVNVTKSKLIFFILLLCTPDADVNVRLRSGNE